MLEYLRGDKPFLRVGRMQSCCKRFFIVGLVVGFIVMLPYFFIMLSIGGAYIIAKVLT